MSTTCGSTFQPGTGQTFQCRGCGRQSDTTSGFPDGYCFDCRNRRTVRPGWLCPVCGMVCSPDMAVCPNGPHKPRQDRPVCGDCSWRWMADGMTRCHAKLAFGWWHNTASAPGADEPCQHSPSRFKVREKWSPPKCRTCEYWRDERNLQVFTGSCACPKTHWLFVDANDHCEHHTPRSDP